MKLLLTSFGTSHLKGREINNSDIFYRMPPVSMSNINQSFMPDYAMLLLADQIIIDIKTYDRLMTDHHSMFGNVALMIKALYYEGFVTIKDFDETIKDNHQILEKMLSHDLKELDFWIDPLKESISTWQEFVLKYRENFRNGFINEKLNDETSTSEEREKYQIMFHQLGGWIHSMSSMMHHSPILSHELLNEVLNSSSKRKKAQFRESLKQHLSEYLSYINGNLLLSNIYETGFHDWNDFEPFYHEKFMRLGRESYPGEIEIKNVKKLFEISFPEFTFWHPDNIIKALKDKRISELRNLIDSASKGEVEFDKEFANRVLSEVFKIETNIGKFRNIVSYATMPLGFIPIFGTPIQKAVEEVIAQPMEHKKRKEFKWFYFISEMARKMKY